MTKAVLVGHRVPANPAGFLPDIRTPGGFGRATFDFARVYGKHAARNGWWQVCAPDGSGCMLNPAIHTVTEHADGMISVTPSIVTDTWHGWLKVGVWAGVDEIPSFFYENPTDK